MVGAMVRGRGRAAIELCQHERAGVAAGPEQRALHHAIDMYVQSDDSEVLRELLSAEFLRGRSERFRALVAPTMRAVEGASFDMGSGADDARHFCGEVPCHRVELSPFDIARIPVTNELFAAFDPTRPVVAAADRAKPVVGVTWLEASLFAIWVGCRLPTEAEWEYACGAGSASQWCCNSEHELARYAWYSENAGSVVQAVATRAANPLGLYDLHGNIWEWCADAYDAAYYASSPRHDPVCRPTASLGRDGVEPDRVCRGGSMHALAEMCRSRYRFHEPAQFHATDLGCRLARSRSPRTAHR